MKDETTAAANSKQPPPSVTGASSGSEEVRACERISFSQLELRRYLARLFASHRNELQRLICVIALAEVGAQR